MPANVPRGTCNSGEEPCVFSVDISCSWPPERPSFQHWPVPQRHKPFPPGRSPWWCRCRPAARSTPMRGWSHRGCRRRSASRWWSRTSPAPRARPAPGASRAPTPDGYTILYGANVTHVLNPAVLNLNYDVVKDFEPIALIGNTPWLFAVKNDLPAKNLPELIAWLKANPDKATFGTAGVGSPSHVGGVLFQQVTGTQVPLHSLSRHRAGDPGPGVRADRHGDPRSDHLAAAAPRRQVQDPRRDGQSSAAPDRRTFRPATRPGVPGVYTEPWQGMWAPAGTPKDVHRQAQRRGGQRADRPGDPARSSPTRATS